MSVGSASLIAMAARWSADSVLDLAPDESSRRSGAGLGRPAPWRGAGVAGDVLWGLCAGSGKNPYQVVVDLQRTRVQVLLPVQEVPLQARARAAAELGQWQRARGERPGRLRRRVAGRAPRPSGKSRKISCPNGPGRLRVVRRPRHRGRTKPPPRAGRSSAPSGSRTAWRSSSPGSGTRSWSACRPRRRRRAGARSRGRDRGADDRCAGTGRGRRPARSVRGPRVGRGVARTAAGRVRAAAPARPRAPADRRPAARARRHRQVQDRVPDQPGGRSHAASGDRPLGGAWRPRPARRAVSPDAASGCAGATPAGGRCC